MIVGSGKVLVISSGMTVENLDVRSGGEVVLEGGTLVNPRFEPGSIETVTSGGRISGIAVSGINNNGTIVGGRELVVSSGGEATDITIASQSTLVFAGGSVSDLKVDNYAYLEVAAGTTLSGLELETGTATQFTVSAGATLMSASLTGGQETILSGGSDSGSILSSGAWESVDSGAKAVRMTVASGGNLEVRGTLDGARVLRGGTIEVAGGTASAITALGGGFDMEGGTATKLLLGGGYSQLLDATVTGVTLVNGGLLGVHSSTINDVVVSSGANLTLTRTVRPH